MSSIRQKCHPCTRILHLSVSTKIPLDKDLECVGKRNKKGYNLGGLFHGHHLPCQNGQDVVGNEGGKAISVWEGGGV